MVAAGRRLVVVMALTLALVGLSGCLSLEAAHLPATVLDGQTGNGWTEDRQRSSGPSGGPLSKQAVRVYADSAQGDPGYAGVLLIQSFRGLLSPDRESLRDDLAGLLREEARAQGLEVDGEGARGERRLANGALSFYIVLNATGTQESFPFAADATVRGIGEVLRCTGGATVITKGFAQVDQSSSIGGIPTSRNYEPQTWRELVQDPFGSIEGIQGSRGLIYNLACG